MGELLYERGQLEEAEALLDDAYELGAEGGLVDFMLRGIRNRGAAEIIAVTHKTRDRRLAEGLEIAKQSCNCRDSRPGLLYETGPISGDVD